MAKNPAFPFYASDWLGSNKRAQMTLAEQGAYINLLARQWTDPACSLPDDDAILARLSEAQEEWGKGGYQMVKACFQPHPNQPGRIANARMLELRAERDEWIAKSSKGGQASALKRWGRKHLDNNKGGYQMVVTKGVTKGQPKCNPPSPSPSPSPKTRTPYSPPSTSDVGQGAPAGYSQDFEVFWLAVPPRKRGAKQAAYRAYRAAVKLLKGRGESPVAFLLEKAAAYYASPLGQTVYCSGAAPFLNQGHYDDDPAAWERREIGDNPTPQRELPELR